MVSLSHSATALLKIRPKNTDFFFFHQKVADSLILGVMLMKVVLILMFNYFVNNKITYENM